MKRATISDAPAVLNTNDKAMWVLGYNAAIEATRSLLLHLQPPAHGWTLETMAASMEELQRAAHDSGVAVLGDQTKSKP